MPIQKNDFLINAAQEVAQNPDFTAMSMTPDNKLSEGIDSVGVHQPAPFLPLIRFASRIGTEVVISSQKPVAHCTTKTGAQYLVPAGLALDIEAHITDGAPTNAKVKYTKADVRGKVLNAKGVQVTDGEAVVASFFEGTTQEVFVSAFCGIANYDVFRHAGGDGQNPATLRYRNYNPQPVVSYNMDYAYEYAMVKDQAAYDGASLEGIAAFIGTKAMAGQFITYDANSNFVLASENTFDYGTVSPTRIIGQASKVVVFRDADTGAVVRNYEQLARVQNYADGSSTMNQGVGLNNVAGSSTGGLPEKVFYANGFGVIQFAIQTR